MYVEKIRAVKLVVKNLIQSCCYRIVKGECSVDYDNLQSIIFLCYGNIIRSPFCEYYFKSCLPEKISLEVASAGFFKKEGRSSPDKAKVAAKSFNIDLSPHRSKTISRSMVENSSLVIGMHYFHYREFKKLFPSEVHKFYLLKPLGNPANLLVNIADPYGKSSVAYMKCYSELKECLNTIVDTIIFCLEKESRE